MRRKGKPFLKGYNFKKMNSRLFLNNIGKRTFDFLNLIIPKKKKIVVLGFPNCEPSAIATANYLVDHYDYPVYYSYDPRLPDKPFKLLNRKINILRSGGSLVGQANYFSHLFSAKYIFMTHGIPIEVFPRKQVVVNIWHGVFYKKLGLLMGSRAIKATTTVATSALSKKMFAQALGVAEQTVFISGYPRNDLLLRAKEQKIMIENKLGISNKYNKILIWLPTFRKSVTDSERNDGTEAGNPFYLKDFDVNEFDHFLKEHNALCFVKPHPMAVKYDMAAPSNSNLSFIDDKWLSEKGITLYDLAGITEILISDVSSVVIDYLLLDQPIICISEDFEDYRQKRGFYFQDIENWLPSKVLKDKNELYKELEICFLVGGNYNYGIRNRLKNSFFLYKDDKSTERLVSFVLGKNRKVKDA
jgi:CDP-glycerol glycerophosphotransferase (TagB/SpsB family)